MKTLLQQPVVFTSAMVGDMLLESAARGFNIPIYQRMYAWTAKEIEKMLTDFYDGFRLQTAYYIGNVTVNLNEETNYFDVIDGQQRLTTLWLIGLVLKLHQQTEWNSFLINGRESRLSFTARERDTQYLRDLFLQSGLAEIYQINTEEVNPAMRAAIKIIAGFINNKTGINLHLFSSYIFNQVRMVAIFLPNAIDLNKYFEDMNNRGLQLEAHHIVKADLLSALTDEKLLVAYAGVWDAISQMNRYLEYSLQGENKENRRILANRETAFDKVIHNYQKTTEQGFTLGELVRQGVDEQSVPPKPKKNTDLADKATAVINFQEFLLHCLKLHLGGKFGEVSLDDKQLLREFTRFKKHIDPDAFIRFLFNCRVLFDEFIIKSLDSGEGTRWEIRVIDPSDEDYNRVPHFRKVVQIQSMLNIGVALSLWFTDTLSYLLHNEKEDYLFLGFLEALDHRIAAAIKGQQPFHELLHKGTNTGRYWFYKLDYLLWKEWAGGRSGHPTVPGINTLRTRIETFQFRDNRSVEHIEPRNPERELWTADTGAADPDTGLARLKDRFGNLALISISSNSSYSNQPSRDKRQDFSSRSNKRGIESLKLVDAYSYDDWTVTHMEEHEQRMIRLLESYHTLTVKGF